jgi:cytochrome c oxidase subunit 1
MHWLGLAAHLRVASGGPTAIDTLGTSFASTVSQSFGGSLRTFVTVATILTVAAQALFLFNFAWTLWRGEKIEDRNPWSATTLEWSVLSPVAIGNFGAAEPMVYRGAYEFGAQGAPEDFAAQNVAPAPSERPPQTRQSANAGAKEN